MPDDRFLHKRCGHSQRVQALTDFDYRVWTAYEMSADDFGVLRMSPVTLQADHDRLAKASPARVRAALEHFVSVELLLRFEHQGQAFVCQTSWQKFQKIEYPRPTNNPIPPDDVLAKCEQSTQDLFALWPGGKRKKRPDESPTGSQIVADGSPNDSQPDPDLARARDARMAMATAKATADGKKKKDRKADPRPLPGAAGKAEFDEVLVEYPKPDRYLAAWAYWCEAAISPTEAAAILADVKRRKTTEWKAIKKQYVPLLKTYLEERRWTDPKPASEPATGRTFGGVPNFSSPFDAGFKGTPRA